MEKIASYTFLPWARRGIGAKIKEKENFDKEGTDSGTDRASIDLTVKIRRTSLSGQEDTRDFQKNIRLFGPGDIIGIDKRSVIRVEPNEDVTNFESNYLPYIEFYEEDFPWRYTPASVNDPAIASPEISKKLRPWLALFVYEEAEFSFEKFIPGATPLPYITLKTDDLFPGNDQYWAWAHVHVNQNLEDVNGATISEKLDNLVKSQPNLACSRLLCPRKLRPNTKYYAFLVPAYEKGRLAGMGSSAETIDAIPGQRYSSKDAGTKMPYYHTWSFRTGSEGDFEELVRRLESMPVDERVGRRLMDIRSPGYGLEYDGNAEIPLNEAVPNGQKGAIYLEGALRPPKIKTENFAKSSEPSAVKMVAKLEGLLNLDTDMRTENGLNENTFGQHPFFVNEDGTPASIKNDPVITPPIYGRWHNLKDKVNKGQPAQWINHLNLDPRQRTVAGFGTKVIQENQEAYMDRAWGQFEGILEANRQLKQAQYVERFSSNLFRKKITKISDERLVLGTTALHARILAGGETLSKATRASQLSNALVTTEFRKIVRPKGPIGVPAAKSSSLDKELLVGSNTGNKQAAERYDTVAVAADGTVSKLGSALGSVFKKPKLNIPVNPETFENLAVATAGPAPAAGTAGVAVAANLRAFPKLDIKVANDNIVIQPQEDLKPEIKLQTLTEKEYLVSQLIFAKYLQKNNWTTLDPGKPLEIDKVAGTIKSQLIPEALVTKRILNRLSFGPAFPKPEKEEIAPIYIAPRFDDAMYRPIVALSSEFLVPNLNLIKNNSVSILETNREFIESYMVGLNHEFSRELLWREYLTDQRGSYFRQFWDINSNSNTTNKPVEEFMESLKDIKPVHTWKDNKLGDNPPPSQAVQDRLVLVVRGDLLRKYPNTIIYLQEGKFTNSSNPDITVPRALKEDGDTLYPAFEAKIAPDIYFFGFNIEVEKARGNLDTPDPGYFVVLKERTGEVHFGMDLHLAEDDSTPKFKKTNVLNNRVAGYESLLLKSRIFTDENGQEQIRSWNSLSWEEFPGDISFIDLEQKPKSPGREQVNWGANAADMAYILYQNPFMMAIHASRMVSEKILNS